MNPEAQRIAIAEVCGWTQGRLTIKGAGGGNRRPTAYGVPPGRSYEAPCLEYLKDLNAMHEAEKVVAILKTPGEYVMALRKTKGVTGGCTAYYGLVHATASQRAEAFLRTLGKWVEE